MPRAAMPLWGVPSHSPPTLTWHGARCVRGGSHLSITPSPPPHPAVAIGLEDSAFPLSSARQEFPYPPAVLVHFSADKNTDAVRACTCGAPAALPCAVAVAALPD